MIKEYKINKIFNEEEKSIDEIISAFLISFLDKDLNNCENLNLISKSYICDDRN